MNAYSSTFQGTRPGSQADPGPPPASHDPAGLLARLVARVSRGARGLAMAWSRPEVIDLPPRLLRDIGLDPYEADRISARCVPFRPGP